jgi:hypothetical protein
MFCYWIFDESKKAEENKIDIKVTGTIAKFCIQDSENHPREISPLYICKNAMS